MTEKPMAPNSAISGENQLQPVAAPSVEHGAEARGNRPAMTDEERAREIVQRYGRTLQPERQMELGLAIWDAIQVSRAEEREKCAKRLDDMACERLKDVHALTDVIHKHAARGSGKKAGKVAAYKKSMARRHLAYRDAAAAIRAMGDKG